jgi:hypothetical protein
LTGSLTGTTPAPCFGQPTGTASFLAGGGVAPYTYSLTATNSITTTNTTATLTAAAGGYTATITDANGCSVTIGVIITSPSQLTNTATVTSSYANGTMISCFGECDAAATSVGAGGVPGSTYTFLWSTSAGSQTTFTATALCAGTHTVTITDQNNCTAIDTVVVIEPAQLAATGTGVNIDCFGAATGSVQVTAVAGTGTPTYDYTLNGVTNSTGLFTGLTAGTYCVTVTDANDCSIVTCVTLTQNTALQIPMFVISNYNGAQISCNGSSDGIVRINTSGGIAPYNYTWGASANNQTTQIATGLSAALRATSSNVTSLNRKKSTPWATQ